MTKLLSICLIVKNEEKTLDKCLNSFAPIADEFIVVDTGSTDNTKEIAKKYTTKIYDFTWVGDFSKARNESIKHAKGTWILIVDADEYLLPEHTKTARLFFEITKPDPNVSYHVSIISFLGDNINSKSNFTEHEITRIFPNNMNFHFIRPIHEQITNNQPEKLRNISSNLSIYHTGYLDETVAEKNKSQRNIDIIQTIRSKSRLAPYDHFTLANEYRQLKKNDKATYHYEKAYKGSNSLNPWRYYCAYNLLLIYQENNKHYQSYSLIEECFSVEESYPDYYFLKGLLYHDFGLLHESKRLFSIAFEKATQLSLSTEKFYLINSQFGSTFPLTYLLQYAKTEKNTQDVVYFSTKLLQANPKDYSALQSLLASLAYNSDPTDIINVIEKIIGSLEIVDLIAMFQISLSIGNQPLIVSVFNKIDDKNLIPIKLMLQYTLVLKDESGFNKILATIVQEEDTYDVAIYIIIGSLLWNNSQLSVLVKNWLIKSDDLYRFYKNIQNNVSFKSIDDQELLDLSSLILSKMFTLGLFNLFDQYIEELQHPIVIDALAQFFYTRDEIDYALSYFSILIEHNKLSIDSLYVLAQFHINEKKYEDAIPFLLEIINQKPEDIKPYNLIISICDDAELKDIIKEKLLQQDSQFRKIPEIFQK